MSEEAAATESNDAAEKSVESEESAEIDWKAQARKHEARAKENAVKAKANEGAAQRLAELEEANKTAEQKTNERLATAEKRAAELEEKANLAEAAATLTVPVDILAGPVDRTPEGLADYAEKLIAFRGEQKPPVPKSSALGRVNQSDTPVETAPGIGRLRAAYGS